MTTIVMLGPGRETILVLKYGDVGRINWHESLADITIEHNGDLLIRQQVSVFLFDKISAAGRSLCNNPSSNRLLQCALFREVRG